MKQLTQIGYLAVRLMGRVSEGGEQKTGEEGREEGGQGGRWDKRKGCTTIILAIFRSRKVIFILSYIYLCINIASYLLRKRQTMYLICLQWFYYYNFEKYIYINILFTYINTHIGGTKAANHSSN